MNRAAQRRFGWRTLLSVLSPGVLLRALAMLLLLGLALLAFTLLRGHAGPADPLEAYLRLGPRAGAETLRRDLLALSPEGRDAGPALQRLVSLGLLCQAPDGASGAWACAGRRQGQGRTLRVTEATLSMREGRLAALSVRMEETRLP